MINVVKGVRRTIDTTLSPHVEFTRDMMIPLVYQVNYQQVVKAASHRYTTITAMEAEALKA
jgi:hypothetical protein